MRPTDKQPGQTLKANAVKTTIALLTAGLAFYAQAFSATAAKPNILVILADDFGYGSANCYGAPTSLVRTPNLDRLAREGRRFTDANTTSSVCSPTRYSVITGRYCWRTSLQYNVLSAFSPLHIETTRLNMASLVKKHGYTTAAVGKWHLGYGTANGLPKWRPDFSAELSPGPLDLGFDYHFAVPSNHGDITGVFVENRFVYGLRSGKIPANMKTVGPVPDSDDFKATYTSADFEKDNGQTALDIDAPRRKNERVMKVLTDKATYWLQQQPKDKPFFLYFTPVAVHNPVTPDKDIAGQSKAGRYGDWIHELDRSVGRILDTLDKMGVAENTLVIFTSDNGGLFKPENDKLPQTAAFKAGLHVNGNLRGGKHDVWEGGFKVPFIVRWPGKAVAGSVCREMISHADILATTAAIVEETLPAAATAAEDSNNILPAILGNPPKPIREDMIVHSTEGVFAIRKGPWKWIEGVTADEVKSGPKSEHKDEHRPQLYNTTNDPAETKDVSAAHPEIVLELRALLHRYRNGGYSRELPHAKVKFTTKKASATADGADKPTLVTSSSGAESNRPYFGARLEPKDGRVLSGAGEIPEGFKDYYDSIGTNKPVVYMTYMELQKPDVPARFAKLKTELEKYPQTFLIPQIGLGMTGSGKPPKPYDDKVAAGQMDAQIDRFCAGLKSLGRPAFIRIGYEFNGQWNGYHPETYKAAFRHVTENIRKAGLENVATVWCLGSRGKMNFMPFYPGDDVVGD